MRSDCMLLSYFLASRLRQTFSIGLFSEWMSQVATTGVASSTERGVASETSERLDLLGLAMLAIANQHMNVSVCNPKGGTLVVGTGEAFCVHALGCSPAAFDLAPGTRHPEAPARHPMRQGRRVDRWGNRLGCGASADGGACCPWPRLLRRKTEAATSPDAKAVEAESRRQSTSRNTNICRAIAILAV